MRNQGAIPPNRLIFFGVWERSEAGVSTKCTDLLFLLLRGDCWLVSTWAGLFWASLWNPKQDAGSWLLYCYRSYSAVLPNHYLTLHHPYLFLFSTWHTKSHVESGRLSWGAEEPPRSRCSNRVWNGFGCWLMWEDPAYCAQCQPRAGGPGMFRDAGWAGARGSKPVSFSSTVPSPAPALAPILTSLWLHCYTQKEAKANHFLPELLLVIVICHSNRKQTTITLPLHNIKQQPS